MSSVSGQIFSITTFGESHGPGVGVVIDGCPAGFPLDLEDIQLQLSRRRPGQNRLTTPRKEDDTLEILSGVFEGKTLGTPIAILVRNTNVKSKDYAGWAQIYRPSHADYTYHIKYGYRTPHGGGRASVRETIGRVAAGALAGQILKHDLGIETIAWVDSVADIRADLIDQAPENRADVDASLVRCPHSETSEKMITAIEGARKAGDSLGGTIGVVVNNVPPGLGDPVFDKLEADLAKACLSISACKGFESGSGFEGAMMRGSEHNDLFYNTEEAAAGDGTNGQEAATGPVPFEQVPVLKTRTNRSGGIQGGITNGMPITARLAFKPVATIQQFQETINEAGQAEQLRPGGRHDPCVLPRAVPIVESVVNLVLMDAYLRQRAANPEWWVRFVQARRAAGAASRFESAGGQTK
ncbi:MAG: chorismate synthase [bacterium]|nr:chorismate synthase [bacterium]